MPHSPPDLELVPDLPVGHARLRLRPGLRAVPREPGVLQVGLDGPRRALVPDHPDVRRLLEALGSRTGAVADPGCPEAVTALARLQAADLTVALHGPPPGRVATAALARAGSQAATRTAARAACRPLLDVPPGLRPELLRLLQLAGLGEPATHRDRTGPRAGAEAGPGVGVALLVVEGEYSRERVDDWVRDGLPHLCVQAHDGVVTLGPYVVPGVTACRRCVDAHLGEADPRRPVIVEQLARRPVDEPVDDALLALALAWAVQDLATAAEGGRPSTWSASARIDPTLALSPRPWTRHPHCGCSWDRWPG